MSKKLVTLSSALLMSLALVACTPKASETKEAKPETTQVSETKTEEQTNSKWKHLKEAPAAFLTDAEIEAMKTFSDAKAVFNSLSEAYASNFDSLVTQVPAEAQEALKPYQEQVSTMMAEQKTMMEEQLAEVDDNMEIPTEIHDTLVSTYKMVRDQYQDAMDLAYEQMDKLMDMQ